MSTATSGLVDRLDNLGRRVPETPLMTWVSRRATARQLRILGFHGVDDLDHFRTQMEELLLRYRPVTAEDVRAAVSGRHRLPDNAMWVTFDDGLPSTFDAGEMLREIGVSATAFVCPASIGTTQRLWFQTVAVAERHGLRGPSSAPNPSLSELKQMSDPDRRRYVAHLEVKLAPLKQEPMNINVEHLHGWIDQGHSIGNHTWDHPCLDTCSPEEQERQVTQAHERLRHWGMLPTLFAYPNGNWAAHAEDVLSRLGYDVGVLFDHRLTRRLRPGLRLSRLRIDSTAPIPRALSIASGVHSGVFHAVQRLRNTERGNREYP